MAARFRVIDTGVRGARANIAFDQALIDLRAEGAIPDTVRFLRFRPSALIGIHQILSHEVRLEHCRARGIEVARRITGGGGLYMDEGQLGWELVFARATFRIGDLAELTRRICEAAAAGLRRLGVAASFRPRNDIEVDGRKISGTGGIFAGEVLFFQGTLLVDFDPLEMIAALKVPAEKLAKRDLDSARRRVITLREVLGEHLPDLASIEAALLEGFADGLGLEPVWGAVSEYEEDVARRLHDEEFGADEFVAMLDSPEVDDAVQTASVTTRGGTIRADIRREGASGERIREVLLTGDFFVSPARTVLDLEAALRGAEVAEAGKLAETFIERSGADLLGATAAEFAAVVEAALDQLSFDADGHRLRGHFVGAPGCGRPTLVFLHDALGCARTWRDVPLRLAHATGCRALVYDRWGSGDSEPLAPPYARDYLRHEALVALPEVLAGLGLREVVLIGHSDGAAIALLYAGAHPEAARGVIAEAPYLFREARTLAAIRAHIRDFEHGDLRARLERHHGARAEALFRRLAEAWTDPGPPGWGFEPTLAGIRCPVLAIQGADDEFFTPAQLDALAAAVPGPVEALRLERVGHVPHHQARTPVLLAMTRFVQALLVAAPSPALSRR